MSAETPKGMNTGRIISIFVGAALVAALGFFIYKYYNEKNKNEVQMESMEGLTAEIEDLESNLDEYQTDLENQELDIEEKERLLAEKEQLLVEKQKRIDELVRSNKLSKRQAATLKGKVEQLEYYIKKYQTEISDLRTQLDEARGENETLAAEVSDIKGQLHDTKRSNEASQFKLKSAAVLNAHTFTYFRIKGSGKAIAETSFRRSQMDNFKSCWKINQNLAADAGPRDVYVRFVDPSGKTIKGPAGGYFEYEDKDLSYSVKKSIEYDRTTQEVCVDFPKPDAYEYTKGTHKVLVYTDGFEIGRGSFEVK